MMFPNLYSNSRLLSLVYGVFSMETLIWLMCSYPLSLVFPRQICRVETLSYPSARASLFSPFLSLLHSRSLFTFRAFLHRESPSPPASAEDFLQPRRFLPPSWHPRTRSYRWRISRKQRLGCPFDILRLETAPAHT